jgi:tetratricopeptide (TPR) repeat protein
MQMKQTGVLGLWALMMVLLLAACGESHEAMLRQLEMLEQMNRADSVMTNDSLAEALTSYFDSHGTANERLRAHYILGRTYADMGEAPAALNAYLDAADCADTTAADCDFRTLGCVYSQMGDVYHRQLLLTNEIEARQKSYHYARIASDTLGYITELKLSASAYILLNKRDSAELILKEALRQYEACGYRQEGLQASTMLMHIYVGEQEHLSDLGSLIEKYDSGSDLFDKNHELPSSKRQYYYYKGRYMEGIGQLDSAEYYYRKVYRPNMSFVDQNPIYRGLLSVFKRRHQADSIAKYAQLYCQANDSSIVLNDQQLTARMAASYQYNRFQKQAFENEKKAEHSRFLLLLSFALGVAVAFGLLLAFSVYRKRKQAQLFQYQRDLEHLERAQTKLQELRSEEQEHSLSTINSLSEEIATLQRRVAEYAKMSERRRTETSLMESDIVNHLRELLAQNPPVEASLADMLALKSLVNEQLPMFYGTLNTSSCTLNPIEYEVCLLIRVRFSPADICKLLGRSDSYISNTRRRILQKVYGIDGKPKDLDDRILAIQ